MNSSQHPLSGLWKPTHIQQLYYGPHCVSKHLMDCLPTPESKAFIITGSSLATKTPLIKNLEKQLGSKHAGTFSNIKQHAPVADLDRATDLVISDTSIDTVISVGGGSAIDSAKAISYRHHEKSEKYLHHVTIPTALSAAECTFFAGYTKEGGEKTAVAHPKISPDAVFYDSSFALYTPGRLWMSTGMRALDHAIELMYHPTSTEMPCRQLALQAAGDLFNYLLKYKDDPKNEDTITRLQLASYASLGFIGYNLGGGLGLSHSLGYALGSPYSIPHGITSCLTLGHVVKLKASSDAEAASQLARVAPFIGLTRSGDDKKDGNAVGDAILDLVKKLGLETRLGEYNVRTEQAAVVTRTATGGQTEGPLYDAVLQIVKRLW